MARRAKGQSTNTTTSRKSKKANGLKTVAEKPNEVIEKKEIGNRANKKAQTRKSSKRNNTFEEHQIKKVAKIDSEKSKDSSPSPNNVVPTSPKTPNIKKLSQKVAQLKEKKEKSSVKKKIDSPVKGKKLNKKLSSSGVSCTEENKGKETSPVKNVHKEKVKLDNYSADEDGDDSDMEWEDVAEVETPIMYTDNELVGDIGDNTSPSTSKSVEVTISMPGKKMKKCPKEEFRKWFERKVNRCRKEFQIKAHKVHLLTLLAIGLRRNKLCNNSIIQAVGLSLLPSQLIQRNISKTSDIPYLMKVTTWLKNMAPLPGEVHTGNSEATHLMRILEKKVYLLVVILRALGLSTRLVMSLQTLDTKLNDKQLKNGATSQTKTPKKKQTPQKEANSSTSLGKLKTPKGKQNTTQAKRNSSTKPSNKSKAIALSTKSSTSKRSKNKSKIEEKTESEYFKRKTSQDSDSDEDFDVSTSKTPKRRRSSSMKGSAKDIIDIQELLGSANSSSSSSDKKGIDIWVEVYIEKEKKWICVDGHAYTVNQPVECEEHATNPIKYVVAFDDENCIKDVTARYASGWLTSTTKLRVEPDWWAETLNLYKTKNLKRDKKESAAINASLLRKSLPTTVSEYKNHPLYALERHLLKFQAIYPDTAATLGFCRGEPVYARDCVHPLHTREIWMKEARVVKTGEKPYKIVKGRKSRRKMLENVGEITADLFGRWQTEEYVPPPVVDGKIPRNEYGNVELFKPSMLPPGTCHLQVPGIHRLARKLDIDAVQAVVGFDFHGGFSHPVIDGVVVCEEHKDTLLEAWDKEQQEKMKRAQQKREKRVLDNWAYLVRSLRIRERLKRKYNMEEEDNPKEGKKEKKANKGDDDIVADVSLSWPLNKQEGKTTRADNGHCHVFLEANHSQDPITGDWSKACSCGHKEPLEETT